MKERVNLLLKLQESEWERLFLISETEILQGQNPKLPKEVFQAAKKRKRNLMTKCVA